MKDIKNPRLIAAKGIFFVIIGAGSSALLLMEHLELRVGVLLGLAIWGFCRAYYFAFYVIERYVDPGYRFSGLWSFVRYMVSRSK